MNVVGLRKGVFIYGFMLLVRRGGPRSDIEAPFLLGAGVVCFGGYRRQRRGSLRGRRSTKDTLAFVYAKSQIITKVEAIQLAYKHHLKPS